MKRYLADQCRFPGRLSLQLRRDPTTAQHSRRGSLFHHTMIYMTLASGLMMIGGVCLHSILRADAADRKESRFLSSLLRAESQLRKDARDAVGGGFRLDSDSQLSCVFSDQNRCVWKVDRGIVTRTVSATDTDMLIRTERYIFPAGSDVKFQQDSADVILVQIAEPSVFVRPAAAAHEGSNLNKPAADTNPKIPAFVAQPHRVMIRLKGAMP